MKTQILKLRFYREIRNADVVDVEVSIEHTLSQVRNPAWP